MTKGGVHHSFEAIGLAKTAEQAFNMLRRGGTANIIGMIPVGQTISLMGAAFLGEKRIQGSLMGSNRFPVDMPRLVDFYMSGKLKLDDMISPAHQAGGGQRGLRGDEDRRSRPLGDRLRRLGSRTHGTTGHARHIRQRAAFRCQALQHLDADLAERVVHDAALDVEEHGRAPVRRRRPASRDRRCGRRPARRRTSDRRPPAAPRPGRRSCGPSRRCRTPAGSPAACGLRRRPRATGVSQVSMYMKTGAAALRRLALGQRAPSRSTCPSRSGPPPPRWVGE